MKEGNFICSGSSSYLKTLYSCGYNVNFIFDTKEFTDRMKYELFEKLKLIDNTAIIKVMTKFVFSINFSSNEHNVIESVFKEIEQNKQSYLHSLYQSDHRDILLRLVNVLLIL